MNVILHPGEQAGRPAGKPRTGAGVNLKDPATAVRYARRLMLNGAWRSVPKTGDDATKAEYTLRVYTPAALAVLPRSAIAALTRPPPAGGCNWCIATFHAATSGGADPSPEQNAFTEAFLGSPCGHCRQRQRIVQEQADVRAALKVEASVAADAGPLAGRIAYWGAKGKFPRQVVAAAIGAALREHARAQDPPRPPAWPRPGPSYYRRRPRRMP